MAGEYFNIWDQFGIPQNDVLYQPPMDTAPIVVSPAAPVVALKSSKKSSGKIKPLTIASAAVPETISPAAVPDFNGLLTEYRGKAQEQNDALKQYLNNQVELQKNAAALPVQQDISPMLAWLDSQFGSNLQSGYTKPRSASDIQAQSDQYNQAVNQARLGLPKSDMDALKTQLDYMFRKDQGDQSAALKQSAISASLQKSQNDQAKPEKSQFFDQLNKDFGKQTGEYLSGGKAEAESNIGIVRAAYDQLKNDPSLTGPGKGSIPLKSIFLPQTKALQDKLASAVQGSLRPILGAQFTEAEGKRIMEQALDPNLSAEENLYRIDRLLTKIEAAKKEKEDAIEYASAHGSLQGYPRLQNLSKKSDFENQDWSAGYGGNKKKNTTEEEDKQALAWAKEHVNDPRAQEILKQQGAK